MKSSYYPNPYLPPKIWEMAKKGAILCGLRSPSAFIRQAVEEKFNKMMKKGRK